MAKHQKTREELIDSYFRMYKNMAQYKLKLANGEIAEQDLWEKAVEKADDTIAQRLAAEGQRTADDDDKEDQEYRERREKEYRDSFDFTAANDEAGLSQVIENEVQQRQVLRELRSTKTVTDKDRLRERLIKLQAGHVELCKSLGIDKKTRDGREQVDTPIQDWRRIKEQGAEKMRQLIGEFGSAATIVETEADLRDAIKYHLGFPFGIVDALLANHRRVLGLSMEVEKA